MLNSSGRVGAVPDERWAPGPAPRCCGRTVMLERREWMAGGPSPAATSHCPAFRLFSLFSLPPVTALGKAPPGPPSRSGGVSAPPAGSGHSCHSSVCAGLARMTLATHVSFLSQPWAAWPYRYWFWGEKGQITAACAYPNPVLCDPARVPGLAAVGVSELQHA